MYALMKLVHIAAAIVWLGGIVFLLVAVRPAVDQLARRSANSADKST